MSNLVIIRYATTSKNTLSAIEFNNSRIAKVTSTTSGMLEAGIYTNNGSSSPSVGIGSMIIGTSFQVRCSKFASLSWFSSNDLRTDKSGRNTLKHTLDNNSIDLIYII